MLFYIVQLKTETIVKNLSHNLQGHKAFGIPSTPQSSLYLSEFPSHLLQFNLQWLPAHEARHSVH